LERIKWNISLKNFKFEDDPLFEKLIRKHRSEVGIVLEIFPCTSGDAINNVGAKNDSVR